MAYVSDFTRFMNDWLAQHPEEQQVRQEGRALWWDKPQDEASRKSQQESRIAQQPYPYFTMK